MGLPELRAFIHEPELLRLLDELIQTWEPPWKVAGGAKPTPTQAIALVTDAASSGMYTLTVEGELGPWIEAFNALCAIERSLGHYEMRRQVKRLTRPEAASALIRLSEQPSAPVRTEAFVALGALEVTPQILDTMVRGASDSSAKVRTAATATLARHPKPALAKLLVVQGNVKGKAKQLIDEAIAALGHKEPARAVVADDSKLLHELVAVWVATHQPEVADLIDVAASQLPHEPIVGRSAAEREVQWHAVAKDRLPASLSSLLATPWPTKWRDGVERLKILRQWRDPRIAAALRMTVASPPYHSQAANSFYFALLDDLAKIPDARQREPLAALRPKLLKELKGYFHVEYIKAAVDGSRLETTLNQSPALPYGAHAEIVERARATLTSAATRASTTKHAEADLLAEIYANPESDTARLVYADFLTERGDPRGELIVLQCTSTPTEETAKRARSVISRHEEQLVGPLGAYITKQGRVFERGFLAACLTEPAMFARGVHEPAWSTVREISFARGAPRELAGVLASPRGASLRVLHGLDHADAIELASDRIEEISYRVRRMAHADHPRLPRLRRLGLIRSRFDREPETDLVEGELWRRLERFSVNDGFTRLPLWLARLATAPRLTELVLFSEHTDSQLADPVGWSVTLYPQPARPKLVLKLHTSDPFSSPLGAIEALPKGSIEVVVAESRALSADPELQDRLGLAR